MLIPQFPPTRLRVIRLARGMTQDDLARLAGVNPAHLAVCERGAALPRPLAKLAAYLGVEDPASLLDRVADLEQRVTTEAQR